MNIFIEPRKRLLKWVRDQLVGSPELAADDFVLKNVLPTDRFPCGALYPITEWGEGIDPACEDVTGVEYSTANSIETPDEPAIIRRYIPPSSLGFSFFIKGEDIRFQLLFYAAGYLPIKRDEKGRFRNDWKRKELVSKQVGTEEFENICCPGENQSRSFQKLGCKARLDVQWRSYSDGWIVTVSFSNTQLMLEKAADYAKDRAEKTLFEASLRCIIESGDVGVYPRVDRSLLDSEEQEIELQYAKRHIYAIGHGCAANWKVRDGKVVELFSETMPAVEVPQMTADTGSEKEPVLSLARLAEMDRNHAILLPELDDFINKYESWISNQRSDVESLADDDCKAGERMVHRMNTAVSRMRESMQLLRDNKQVRLAFALANRTMLDQMRQHDNVKGTPSDDSTYRWRPFQLGFLLTTLESTVNDESDFRDTVDLIWFPTGGGKTEAYLGMIAFLIALRRLYYTDKGGGTTVLMRYTLRLLTRDQFLRATRMICALELIRRKRDDLGTSPVTIGMWVGEPASPNTFRKAAEIVTKARNAGKKPELVLGHCPWCGEEFETERNYVSTNYKFHFICRNSNCAFGMSQDELLPCNVVDEALYENPPTMLVATVDKFARLTWEDRANVFFGGTKYRAPELIIQDELHLIASALGSVAGLYEAAIDTVLQIRNVYPKYIASTATIRMAEQQVRQLYGKEVAVFPPPGLSYDDSYFARTIPLEKKAGRIYVGYLAPMLNRQKCMVPLAAALMAAPYILFSNDYNKLEMLDAWWTQVVYHGSLKGVGNSHTAFLNEVRDFVRLIEDTITIQSDENENTEEKMRTTPYIAQLTSLQTATQNAEIFSRLSKKYNEDGHLDTVLATNMISVGLDVARLSLMIINGQPLTTAEYIQASSRVGRSEVPGLVFANYYRSQARSLSHYESFRPYHEAFYRFVEPTSVTPYTYQARLRALAAALVLVIRHCGIGLLDNTEADKFESTDKSIGHAIEKFKLRCNLSAPDLADDVNSHIDNLIASWQTEVDRCKTYKRKLNYHVPDSENAYDRLLYNHDDNIRGLWQALQSFRNVENTALLMALQPVAKEPIPIRLSHLLGHSGVGAIVRGADITVVVNDTRKWADRQSNIAGVKIPYVDRARAALGLSEQLYEPPVAKKMSNGNISGSCIPATRFPTWVRCPACGAMYRRPWSSAQPDQILRCSREDCKKRPELEQVSWALAHPSGFLNDVPWHYLAHKDSKSPAQQNCKIKDQLFLIEGGYAERTLRCNTCGANTSFRGNEQMAFGRGPMQPWTQEDTVPDEQATIHGAQVLVITDTRVYNPVSSSVLMIPPESRVRKGTVIDLLYRNSNDRKKIDDALPGLRKKSIMKSVAEKYRCSTGDIEAALIELDRGYPLYGETFTPGQILESEFKAFLEIREDQREDEDLVTHNRSEQWRKLIDEPGLKTEEKDIVQSISHLVRVDRLKEIKVFMGFTRIDDENKVPPDIIGRSDWLPAVQLYGEGIFIALNEDRLMEWENNPPVVTRLDQLKRRFTNSGRNTPISVTTRFMLLHTLSHLIMRQIEAECGYPAASLTERIYCSNTPFAMSGILIYVAVPDIAGSLGGLAELSEPRRFLGVLVRALEHSRWCSLDPVCSEHEGQGPSLLNRAACHACTLVPDPACEYGNTLLDRGFIKGDADATNGFPSFFGGI